MRQPKYRRALPEDRRGDLVEATLKCLAEHGHAGVSVRRIAAQAGVRYVLPAGEANPLLAVAEGWAEAWTP